MSEQVSFLCSACEATLSIPVELAGISGPCPYCGTEVTSPRPEVIPAAAARAEVFEGRAWEEARTPDTADAAEWVRPRRNPAWLVAAGITIFVGGVAGAWKLWESAPEPKASAEALPPVVHTPEAPIPPRPAALATAADDQPADSLPPPSEEMPAVNLTPVPAAVARDVSTSVPPPPVRKTPPIAPPGPESPLLPVVDPGSEEVKTPAVDQGETEKKISAVIPHTGKLEKPGKALIGFFASAKWQDRMGFVLAPEKVKPLMEAHYRKFPDGPVIPTDIELTRIEPIDEDPSRSYFSWIVYIPGHESGIPLSVEETKNGCRVEWASFAEGKERLLAAFYSGFRKENGTFRVLVRRTHYFEADVPDQDKKVVFDLLPPENSGPYKAWMDKDSSAYRQYFASGERTGWDVSSMMVLTLQWEKNPEGAQWVRIQDVASDTWHPAFLGTGTNTASKGKQATPSPESVR